MRTMLRWTVPADRGNEAVQDGSMQTALDAVLARTQPEAAYFLADQGDRSGIIFFDLKEPSDIPGIAEILFQGLDASVEFIPCMNADDLKKALAAL
jgi:hypothetical protein